MGKFIDRTGETNVNNQGLKMEIIKYKGTHDIDILFEDGTILYSRNYKNFREGSIKNKNYKDSKSINKTGEVNYNSHGLKMWIKEYRNSQDIDIEFEDGYIALNKNYGNFKRGKILNPNRASVLGVGIKGDISTMNKLSDNGKYERDKSYKAWHAMLVRCYDKNFKSNFVTYECCKVCDEWLYYPNFKKWYDENYYEIEGKIMCLDKDILVKNNKIYSPETCIFVPNDINVLFVRRETKRGKYPIGVSRMNNKYYININYTFNGFKSKYNYENIMFDTPEKAFYAYKEAKEEYIRYIADQYKDLIPDKLYEAMYNWKVEITD